MDRSPYELDGSPAIGLDWLTLDIRAVGVSQPHPWALSWRGAGRRG
jgi:hypothetical protein